MSKNKHPIFRMHKIKVHHNRWLIWASAYMVFVAIALVGYIAVTNLNFDSELLVAENEYKPWRSYTNHELGFALRYPGEWSIEAMSNTSIDFVPVDMFKSSLNISVYPASNEKDLIKALDVASERTTDLAGVTAKEFVNRLTVGTAVETVLLAVDNRRVYVIRGEHGPVRQFAQTFRFINE
jgi:hypothetical protein